jgi:hypothetical protein
MSDTLELLETIGQDATLRHASVDELTNLLEQAQASEALKAAVASGDSSPLTAEFGQLANLSTQTIQTPGHEEEEEEDEDGDGEPAESLAYEDCN